jgi:hypothetical protein
MVLTHNIMILLFSRVFYRAGQESFSSPGGRAALGLAASWRPPLTLICPLTILGPFTVIGPFSVIGPDRSKKPRRGAGLRRGFI